MSSARLTRAVAGLNPARAHQLDPRQRRRDRPQAPHVTPNRHWPRRHDPVETRPTAPAGHGPPAALRVRGLRGRGSADGEAPRPGRNDPALRRTWRSTFVRSSASSRPARWTPRCSTRWGGRSPSTGPPASTSATRGAGRGDVRESPARCDRATQPSAEGVGTGSRRCSPRTLPESAAVARRGGKPGNARPAGCEADTVSPRR